MLNAGRSGKGAVGSGFEEPTQADRMERMRIRAKIKQIF
jgi:hypothetical protein